MNATPSRPHKGDRCAANSFDTNRARAHLQQYTTGLNCRLPDQPGKRGTVLHSPLEPLGWKLDRQRSAARDLIFGLQNEDISDICGRRDRNEVRWLVRRSIWEVESRLYRSLSVMTPAQWAPSR
jgi:hypothetical protein